MSTPAGYRLVTVDRERAIEFANVAAFAFVFSIPEREIGLVDATVPWGRARAIEVTDSDRGSAGSLAAVHSSFPFDMRVPGGAAVSTAGLSWVSVHPGHRRRGLLRAMIDDHLARSIARGEVLSALYAAEVGIYERFGYGAAGYSLRVELPRGAELRDVPGSDALNVSIDTADATRDAAIIASIQARVATPGAIVRFGEATIAEMTSDPESERGGAEQLRIAVVRDGDEPVAWALFQRKNEWGGSGPDGKVTVRGWAALTAAATRRLWSVLVDFDLMSTTRAHGIAPHGPLMMQLRDVRAAKATATDTLWIRVLDVPRALSSRSYGADCDVVIEVDDALVPDNAGRWRLLAEGGYGTVTRADDSAPDIKLSAAQLGSVYLGGITVADLWRAGLVDEPRPGAAVELSRALTWDVSPTGDIGF